MSLAIPSIADADVAGKTVLVRADLNVPLENGVVSDATRIERVAPTFRDLAARGAKVVIMSHFGRPKGAPDPQFSLSPVAEALKASLGRDVTFVPETVGADAEQAIGGLGAGDIALLENLRFHEGETGNDKYFALQLAGLADIYVNDAFSCAHRAHASTHAVAQVMPAYMGLAMAKEIEALTGTLDDPDRPVAALVGGAKVSSKIAVLEHLVPRMDAIIIGGGMANTFLMAQGYSVGKSLAEPDLVDLAKRIMAGAAQSDCDIVLPVDVVVAESFAANAPNMVAPLDGVDADGMILDVGPATIAALTDRLSGLRTLLWNGPLGAFEMEPFGTGTFAVAKAAAEQTRQGRLTTVAGGGDTVAALNAAGVADDFTYVSTAGGAFLEWLEGKELPGIEALRQANTQFEEV